MGKLHKPAHGHVRKAFASKGDDITFSRFVKLDGAGKTHGKVLQLKLSGIEHPAMVEGRTYFRRSVKRVAEMTNLLVSGHNNIKIGRDIRVGKFIGYWLYTLSLQERATCPRSCHHWQNCYGNQMPYAKRIEHDDPAFLPALEANIERVLSIKNRIGVMIRLHALGDFYSERYVGFWASMLAKHDRLAIFGYTAWDPTTDIGGAVDRLVDMFPGRAMIRFSNGGLDTRCTVPIINAEDCPPGAFVCPEQTGQFDACGKCGACWSTLKNVAFIAH